MSLVIHTEEAPRLGQEVFRKQLPSRTDHKHEIIEAYVQRFLDRHWVQDSDLTYCVCVWRRPSSMPWCMAMKAIRTCWSIAGSMKMAMTGSSSSAIRASASVSRMCPIRRIGQPTLRAWPGHPSDA